MRENPPESFDPNANLAASALNLLRAIGFLPTMAARKQLARAIKDIEQLESMIRQVPTQFR